MTRFLIAILVALTIIPVLTFAQGEPGFNKMSLGANFEVSVPVGDFSSLAGTGYGGNLRYQYGSDFRHSCEYRNRIVRHLRV